MVVAGVLFGSGRTAGWVCHRGRTDITLAGSHCRDPPTTMSQAGWAPSPCRLPGPVTRYVQVSVGFSPPRLQRAPPVPSARKCVRGRVCGASSQAGLLYLRLGQYLGFLVLGTLGNLVLGNLVPGNRAGWRGCMLGIACVQGKVCRAYAGRISCGALLFCPGWHHLTPGGVRVQQQQQQQQQQASHSCT